MPFAPPSTTGLMVSKGASQKMAGEKFMPMVSAVSSAVSSFMPGAPVVNSTNVVTGPGAGTYFAKIVGAVPVGMTGLMMAKSSSTQTIGRDTKKLFDAVSFGVCNTLLSTAMSQGTVVGGGPGVGQGKIVGLVPTALQGLIMANLGGKKILGEKTAALVSAMAFGICNHIMSAATVVTTCVGSFSPPPAGPVVIPSAPGFGKLV